MLELVTVLLGVVTAIAPVVAPIGTVAVILVALLTVKLVTVIPLKETAVAPVKLDPVIVTVELIGPLEGEKEVIVGGGSTVKLVVLVPVPLAVVIVIGPVVVPTGTVAVICVGESTTKFGALIPLKLTAVAPVKSVPVITTVDPIAPDEGVIASIAGGGFTHMVAVAAHKSYDSGVPSKDSAPVSECTKLDPDALVS